MEKYTTVSAQFLSSSLPLDKEILRKGISFRVKTTYIENKYELYSITCEDGSSMMKRVDSTVSYTPDAGIIYLHIIINIESAEGLIFFFLNIYNAFQNNIILNT